MQNTYQSGKSYIFETYIEILEIKVLAKQS